LAAAVFRATKSGKSIVFERSECTTCGRKLSAIDLVPLFSFLFLRAKCRTCKKAISWRYFVIELCAAVMVSLIVYQAGFSLESLEKVVAVLVLFSILLIDLDTWLIFTPLSVFLIIWGLAFGLVLPDSLPAFDRAIGVISGFAVLAAVLLIATFILRRTGRLQKAQWAMGWGDPILMAAIGALVGYKLLIFVLWLASIQAIVVYVFLRFRHRNFALIAEDAHAQQQFTPPDNALPLGTFLCLATMEVIVATDYVFALGFLSGSALCLTSS
jgi:leader peptidase (prepilin peptidase)/N-methyltransferase